jgi:transcriptional regulator with XRE-family HTH domain
LSGKRMSRLLKRIRVGKGLTQRDLAKRAGVTQGYVAQLEMGIRRNPSIDTLKRLAKALGVSVTALLE